MRLRLHYNLIVAKFVANESHDTDGCPFMEFGWSLVGEINFEYIILWDKIEV
jgi:hypothetical protein